MVIALCGFMGAGKTANGRLLAQKLNYRFADLDEVIVKRKGMTVKEIFAAHGEDAFRQFEHECLSECVQGADNTVLSLGGGALGQQRNCDLLAKCACVVFVDTPFETCYERIKDSDRPLVKTKTKTELHDLFNSRVRTYSRAANIIVNTQELGEDKDASTDYIALEFHKYLERLECAKMQGN